MSSPLIRTKLYVPPPRPGLVARPRLVQRLDGPAGRRLLLVSAPPGFGKTTLLAAWAQAALQEGRAVAWVSLDGSDQAPSELWAYVVAALDGAAPGVGASATALLDGGQASVETVLTVLLNELSERNEPIDLVLDDYHLVDGPQVAADLSFLLQHLPAHVRVAIGTRADPALPLALLRARGELVEVRAADLRFTPAEAAAYLNDVAGLDLGRGDVDVLEERTEGWIAALQLAVLSLRGRTDRAAFITGFAGDDRHVVDYLVEEVIARQPRDVRDFLLATCVLERLGGSLCDAVTGREDSSAVLEHLERANLFVVPLDDTRRWYRYHHLFAEVLRSHLREGVGDVVTVHLRAARWYAAHGQPAAAVRHALAGGDVELAADVVEGSVIGLLRDRQEPTVRRWVDLLPDDVVQRRPVLAVGLVGGLMSSGEFAGVEARLAALERVLDEWPEGTSVLHEEELPRLPGAMQTYRAALALVRGDPAAAVLHADLAVERAAPGDDLTVAAAAALSGLASWGSGDLETAHRSYTTAVEGLRRAGNHSDVLGCSITLADLRITQGRLDDAVRTYDDALLLAARHTDGAPLRGTVDMLVGLALVALERGDLAAAQEHLRRADDLGEQNGLPQHPYRLRAARAQVLQVQGDQAGAVRLLEEADRVYVGDFSPNVRPVPAQRARALLSAGRLPEALDWASGHRVTADDELHYVREFEHVTLARILLRQSAVEGSRAPLLAAVDLLDRLHTSTCDGGRVGTLVEVCVLQALAHRAHHGRHDVPGALGHLERALQLAGDQRQVRVFVDEGAPVRSMLEALSHAHPSWAHPRRLLAAFAAPTPPPATSAADQGLVDPLSARELEVLRLLATDLDGPAIARELVVSLNTVRSHTKSIYAKLGVNSRLTAVSRAGELRLIGPRR